MEAELAERGWTVSSPVPASDEAWLCLDDDDESVIAQGRLARQHNALLIVYPATSSITELPRLSCNDPIEHRWAHSPRSFLLLRAISTWYVPISSVETARRLDFLLAVDPDIIARILLVVGDARIVYERRAGRVVVSVVSAICHAMLRERLPSLPPYPLLLEMRVDTLARGLLYPLDDTDGMIMRHLGIGSDDDDLENVRTAQRVRCVVLRVGSRLAGVTMRDEVHYAQWAAQHAAPRWHDLRRALLLMFWDASRMALQWRWPHLCAQCMPETMPAAWLAPPSLRSLYATRLSELQRPLRDAFAASPTPSSTSSSSHARATTPMSRSPTPPRAARSASYSPTPIHHHVIASSSTPGLRDAVDYDADEDAEDLRLDR